MSLAYASAIERQPLNLDAAVVYDIESLPNVFSLNAISLFGDELDLTFEVSEFRDHRRELFAWLNHWQMYQTPMVGFNSLSYDYPVLHFFWQNPEVGAPEIFDFSQSLINNYSHFNQVWESDRLAPQIDLYKMNHFDNRAKSTGLKALEVTMRADEVVDMPLPFDRPATSDQIVNLLLPYNKKDVIETRRFAHFNLEAIKFRMGLMSTLHGDVINWNDTKIGAKILEQRLGDDACYTRETGRREPRQSPRNRIPLSEIIFPYIEFKNPEFNRVLSWMREQVLTSDDLTDESATIKTKGVFTGVTANVGGIDFCFGTGGIHGSVSSQRFVADEEYALVDIDVASLYPNIAIQNGLYPEHLGEAFVHEYARLPIERKEWQAKKGKKCVEANAMKLAANGTYGNSNNQFSPFYDSRFTMTITINGQLLLCMLAEWLLTVETLQIISVNTDGITFRCHKSRLDHARIVQRIWERKTRLVLEEVQFSRMWIRDCNSYVAENTDGSLKLKGAFWFPRTFPDDISNAQPPAWHKDFSAQVSIMAAVEHMVTGVPVDRFVYGHADPFDFMLRAKVDRSSKLMIGEQEVQRICRYFVSTNGGGMRKVSPPVKGAQVGDWKRRNGISDAEYAAVLQEIPPGTWDERVHTKNKSKYEIRETAIESGYKVTACNRASDFDFQNLNYDYYIERARKLVIG